MNQSELLDWTSLDIWEGSCRKEISMYNLLRICAGARRTESCYAMVWWAVIGGEQVTWPHCSPLIGQEIFTMAGEAPRTFSLLKAPPKPYKKKCGIFHTRSDPPPYGKNYCLQPILLTTHSVHLGSYKLGYSNPVRRKFLSIFQIANWYIVSVKILWFFSWKII